MKKCHLFCSTDDFAVNGIEIQLAFLATRSHSWFLLYPWGNITSISFFKVLQLKPHKAFLPLSRASPFLSYFRVVIQKPWPLGLLVVDKQNCVLQLQKNNVATPILKGNERKIEWWNSLKFILFSYISFLIFIVIKNLDHENIVKCVAKIFTTQTQKKSLLPS